VLEDDTPEELHKYSRSTLYQKYSELPYTETRRHFEHELRAHVADTTPSSHSDESEKTTLKCFLKNFPNAAQAYLPDWIEALCRPEQNNIRDAQARFQALVEIALEEINKNPPSSIGHALLTNPQLALDVVKTQPNTFFHLSKAIQRSVHLALLQDPDTQDQAKLIFDEAERLLAVTTENQPTPILDEEQRKRLSVTPKDQTYTDYIYSKIKDEGRARQLINKDYALRRINAYLKTKPNAFKTNVFLRVRKSIEENGLTMEMLKTEAGKEDNVYGKLFKKWSGRSNSNAARCLYDLIRASKDDWQLDDYSCQQILDTKKEEPETPKQTEAIIKRHIRDTLENPHNARKTELGRKIYAEMQALENCKDVIARNERNTASLDNANTQQSVIEQALLTLTEAQDTLRFDPQGHALVYLKNGISDQPTFCNIDIMEYPYLAKQVRQALTNRDEEGLSLDASDLTNLGNSEVNPDELDTAIQSFQQSDNRGSIIPLQEEAEMHIRQLSRSIQKCAFQANNSIQKEEWEEIRLNAAIAINTEVLEIFRVALVEACRQADRSIGALDIAKLNRSLDFARSRIAHSCKTILMQMITNAENEKSEFTSLSRSNLKEILSKANLESTTATGAYYLRTNNRNQTVTLISPTEETAHKKKEFDAKKQAFRILQRHHFKMAEDGTVSVTPERVQTREARVPAMPVVDSPHKKSVQDVADKLAHNYRELQAMSGDSSNGPMVYNVLMSLRGKAYDAFTLGFWTPPGRKNRERLRSVRILKGAHVFNARQIKQKKIHNLCYVQQIPVNQHGEHLSYRARDSSHREALLMSEIALLATLSEQAAYLPPLLREKLIEQYETVHQYYIEFLSRQEQGKLYFNDSKEGAEAIATLKAFKQWIGRACTNLPVNTGDSLESLVTRALLKLMGTSTRHRRSSEYLHAHQNLKYGTLIQSLSVFLETMSQTGCKSGNERYQMVAGRVELLHSIASRKPEPQSTEEQAFITALKACIETKDSRVDDLQRTLDEAYNAHNLQGSATAISTEDQGGPSKVKASKNQDGLVSELDTNYAESGFLKYLYQKCASAMQVHKDDHVADLEAARKAVQAGPVEKKEEQQPALTAGL